MLKSVSIVDARRQLGKLADEVQVTGRPVVLTRRGKPVARLVRDHEADPKGRVDALGALRGTITLSCTDDELVEAIRELRGEFAESLERRARQFFPVTEEPRG